jgi:hypothetical protein
MGLLVRNERMKLGLSDDAIGVAPILHCDWITSTAPCSSISRIILQPFSPFSPSTIQINMGSRPWAIQPFHTKIIQSSKGTRIIDRTSASGKS